MLNGRNYKVRLHKLISVEIIPASSFRWKFTAIKYKEKDLL